VVLVVGVEGVGLVELLLAGALGHHRALHGGGGLSGHHAHLRLGGRGHHVGRDGQGLLQLRGQVTGLGAHGHFVFGVHVL
jgi:hypothetical protein